MMVDIDGLDRPKWDKPKTADTGASRCAEDSSQEWDAMLQNIPKIGAKQCETFSNLLTWFFLGTSTVDLGHCSFLGNFQNG